MEPIRILFVDDERNVLRSLERLFLEEEYEIFTSASGQEGLEIIDQSGPFQLIVSDYRMPSMNGVEFLSEVFRRWPDTERIILSGYADTAAIVAAINEGRIYKFIAKPWNDDDLMQAIREVIDRYKLRASNRSLLEELSVVNRDLKAINDNLNEIVDERFKVVLSQSRALQSFQTVLDILPVGFIGADGYGMIVQCNRLGAEMLGLATEELIGNDLSTTMPAPLIQKVIELPGNSCGDFSIELPYGRCHIHVTRLSGDDQNAIVIALLKEP
ncbi:MAG TPA: response regulator [Dongiaceae bacterium]|nr:response regulator [Dongiaceae bacterium]